MGKVQPTARGGLVEVTNLSRYMAIHGESKTGKRIDPDSLRGLFRRFIYQLEVHGGIPFVNKYATRYHLLDSTTGETAHIIRVYFKGVGRRVCRIDYTVEELGRLGTVFPQADPLTNNGMLPGHA